MQAIKTKIEIAGISQPIGSKENGPELPRIKIEITCGRIVLTEEILISHEDAARLLEGCNQARKAEGNMQEVCREFLCK